MGWTGTMRCRGMSDAGRVAGLEEGRHECGARVREPPGTARVTGHEATVLQDGELAATLGAGPPQLAREDLWGGAADLQQQRQDLARRLGAIRERSRSAGVVERGDADRDGRAAAEVGVDLEPAPGRLQQLARQPEAAPDAAHQGSLVRPGGREPGGERERRVGDARPVVADAYDRPAGEDAHQGVAKAGVHEVLDDLADGERRERRAGGDGVAQQLDERRRVVRRELLDGRGLAGRPVDGQPAGDGRPGDGADVRRRWCEGKGRGHRGGSRGGHFNPATGASDSPFSTLWRTKSRLSGEILWRPGRSAHPPPSGSPSRRPIHALSTGMSTSVDEGEMAIRRPPRGRTARSPGSPAPFAMLGHPPAGAALPGFRMRWHPR